MKARPVWQCTALLTSTALVIAGLAILSFSRAYKALIETQGDSLRVQGEVIAAVIAADESAEIPPERVAPILRRLVRAPDTRARVFARDGTLIVDTAGVPLRGRPAQPESLGFSEKPRRGVLETASTRALSWLARGEMAAIRAPAGTNGAAYPELRMALDGSVTSALLVVESGELVVSVAVPIQSRTAVEGVLLLTARAGT